MNNSGDLRQDAQRLAGQNTRIKVCGLKRPEDIESVNLAKPDFCGFIVEFPRSSRWECSLMHVWNCRQSWQRPV